MESWLKKNKKSKPTPNSKAHPSPKQTPPRKEHLKTSSSSSSSNNNRKRKFNDYSNLLADRAASEDEDEDEEEDKEEEEEWEVVKKKSKLNSASDGYSSNSSSVDEPASYDELDVLHDEHELETPQKRLKKKRKHPVSEKPLSNAARQPKKNIKVNKVNNSWFEILKQKAMKLPLFSDYQ